MDSIFTALNIASDLGTDRSDLQIISDDEDSSSTTVRSRGPQQGRGADQYEDRVVITIGNGNKNALQADTVEYTAAVPQYPKTAEGGYAYVIRLRGSQATETETSEILKWMKGFQYSKAGKASKKTTYCPLLETHAMRWVLGCSGIKHCEFIQNELLAISHTEVDSALYEKLRQLRGSVSQIEENKEKRNAKNFYEGVRRRFLIGTCTPVKLSCGPVLAMRQRIPLTGNIQWLITCRSFTRGTQEHHFSKSVPLLTDIDYLRSLLSETVVAPTERCNVVEPQCSRLKLCGTDHIQGQGSLQKRDCSVVFNIIIPSVPRRVPYCILVSTGVHTHIPPPLWLVDQDHINDILRILQPILYPGITRTEFLKSPALLTYLQQRGYNSIEDFHLAFTDKDRITRLVHRERLVMFPYGGGLEGVMFEWKTHHKESSTACIQKILPSSTGDIIICLYRDQAILLASQDKFQMDMSFKRFRDSWAEILFATFDVTHGKIITLGRIVTNTQTAEMYEKAFVEFFGICGQLTGSSVKWMYLHYEGIIGLTVDMNSKQMAGFGRYLNNLDPLKRGWRYQLSCCLRFCEIHFLRGIDKACGPSSLHTEDSDWGRMKALLTASSMSEYMELCKLIGDNARSKAIKDWAKHKESPVIAAGLNHHCNHMSLSAWNTLDNNSNAVEQAAQKGYRSGTRHKLLQGVRMGAHMDMQDIKEYKSRNEYGVRHKSRQTSSVSTRFFQNVGREMKRQKSHELLEIADDQDDILESLEDFSSSGVRQSRLRKRSLKPPKPRQFQSSPLRSSPMRSSPPIHPSLASTFSRAQTQSQALDAEREAFRVKKERAIFEREQREFRIEEEEAEVRLKAREDRLQQERQRIQDE